ncbi:splicing regulator muscleblind isoform X9 [Leptinotarsa decemlineata]|uniref:splicing regulator muscleblind isoform X9 n=1 Tax=Leptinotarsa decemlineata TaxID=7539 RepID=UPI003D304715
MAMLNMNNLLNGKDSRWLQLEVCREFQRNKCSRPDTECKFAHPPANVEVQNGRVTACYDSIKGRCNREKPPCKYFHPPQHLKDQLLINGRNHLALKNALMQQMGLTPGQALVPGQVQAVVDSPIDSLPLTFFPHLSMTIEEQYALMAANPYLTGMPQVGSTYSPYFAPGPIMPTIMGPDPTGVGSPLGVVPQTVVTQQKMPRSDRLEMDMKSVGSFYYDNFQAFPAGMVPYKRTAADKSGVPVYQPNATTYQQLMQLQQPFVPVSCEYSTSPAPPSSSCASPTVSEASQPIVTTQISQQSQQLSQQPKDETFSGITSTASLSSLPPPQPQIPDPATLAKEVAQQNYAKAVKLAAVNQSLAASQFSHLNPLNYTGVALNKQALAAMPQTAAAFPRYPTLPFQFNAAALNLGLANPYQAIAQQNLLNLSRPPPVQFNPYSIMRQPQYATATAAGASSLYGNNLLSAQYPVTVSAAPITNSTAAQASIAVAAAQNNNNNVTLQPYKKLKTN